ncbi:NADH:flavin oxidoreductase/NADH oxidase family protein [Acinetobacter sp. ANC 3882]|uniref:NADH:flavin oxidoreductase/NADH oxidase family protein n=1 Tax=Acinetobacter sp. ANC 3882 TaxID=2923423 RepID=UPI001F4B54BE|nr:NADH:flavin oxidoreductase/NADH oxidase family protein [Acinetobacter sp. ANC 3882]MCH7313111.1 NADH:flavin oxidoreductase/NADH oxidase family protein [Acinetobacter sp. ANC 3882]
MQQKPIPPRLINQPFALGHGVELSNRLVKASLSERLATTDGRVTQKIISLYQRWSRSGAGLLITGNVMIDRRAIGEPNNVVVEDERDLAMLQKWVAAGTQNGAQLWMQINHPGKQAPRGLNKDSVSASAIPFSPKLAAAFATPRALTEAEIEDLITRFGRTARIAQKAGFSGVEIHGAHGYLVSQFLSPHHNQRTDRWGGNAENRQRFVLEVYREIRRQVGTDFPIGIKLNSADFQRGGFTEEESLSVIQALSHAGIDLIEISGGTYENPVNIVSTNGQKTSTQQREAYFLEFAEKVRTTVKTPLMVTGGFRSQSGMQEALASGGLDLVGLGRGLIVEPNFPALLLKGLEANHPVKPISTGIGFIDKTGAVEMLWYARQIHLMAKGLEPKPNEHALLSLLNVIPEMGISSLRSRLRV